MTRCENCGADSVDARGVCRTCGWQASDDVTLDDDSPSLGATRAADVLEPKGTRAPRSGGATPPRPSTSAQYGASSAGTPPSPRGGTGTARFCGTCGARLEPGEAFCGQCGTPVSAAGDYTRNVPAGSTSRYYVGGNGGWSGSNGDDYTEAFTAPPLPAAAPYNRPSTAGGGPYTPPGFGAATPPATDQSRTGRIVFGLLCILGSLVSAAGAVYIAFAR
ncbi:MAG TPA: zinc ribbon domain-containing protein [Ktedonobacterales bacterium]